MISHWISGLLGLVIVAVPFLSLSSTTLTWTLVITGSVITISSFWDMFTETDGQRVQGTQGRRV